MLPCQKNVNSPFKQNNVPHPAGLSRLESAEIEQLIGKKLRMAQFVVCRFAKKGGVSLNSEKIQITFFRHQKNNFFLTVQSLEKQCNYDSLNKP